MQTKARETSAGAMILQLRLAVEKMPRAGPTSLENGPSRSLMVVVIRTEKRTWAGLDEMDEASGGGEAQLAADGNIPGQIRFHLGDESSFSARRW